MDRDSFVTNAIFNETGSLTFFFASLISYNFLKLMQHPWQLVEKQKTDNKDEIASFCSMCSPVKKSKILPETYYKGRIVTCSCIF